MNKLDSLDFSIIRAVYNKHCESDGKYITLQGFTDVLNSTGERDSNLIDALFAYADTKKYQKMTFDEFARWWTVGEYRKRWKFPRSRTLLKEGYALFTKYTAGVVNLRSDRMTFEQFSTLLRDIDREDRYGDTFDSMVGDRDELSFKEFYAWLKW